jgi:hypothetical protein
MTGSDRDQTSWEDKNSWESNDMNLTFGRRKHPDILSRLKEKHLAVEAQIEARILRFESKKSKKRQESGKNRLGNLRE